MSRVGDERKRLISRFFPSGVPGLWCPLLTRYASPGAIDFAGMSLHLGHLSRSVKGYLIPGSTGDGWELTEEETMELVEFAVGEAGELGFSLLVGVLRPTVEEMQDTIERTCTLVRRVTGAEDAGEALRKASVCGFAVCPPTGKDLTQGEIMAALAMILARGLPIALYQLPQVTENEIAPETCRMLVETFPNLILFKDTSGNDRVALSPFDKEGLFLVRGAEGGYSEWLKAAGGPYDGLLLSTVNSFPSILAGLMRLLEEGDASRAKALSDSLSEAVREVFAVVDGLPRGNPFTNANKAIDHFMAFGPSAPGMAPPLLHSGISLPAEVIARTGEILSRLGLMPGTGYLAGR